MLNPDFFRSAWPHGLGFSKISPLAYDPPSLTLKCLSLCPLSYCDLGIVLSKEDPVFPDCTTMLASLLVYPVLLKGESEEEKTETFHWNVEGDE